MHLKRIAQWFDWAPFDVLVSGAFEAGFTGRLGPTDRFLSNFNKPLRRRMLFVDTEAVIPASKVFRDPGSMDIYMIGKGRKDTYAGAAYHNMYVAHEAEGQVDVRRKATAGPSDNPGWLVESVVAQPYYDLELRSAGEVDGAVHMYSGNYFLHLPQGTDAVENDYLTITGAEYRIEEVYLDSGFTVARVVSEADRREDLVFKVNASSAFDFSAGRLNSTDTAYNVTGLVIKEYDIRDNLTPESGDYLTIVIEDDHIGFVPEPGMRVVRSGKSFEISHVEQDFSSKQWKVKAA